MESSYKPRLKTILKQHHFNVNRAQMNKYSCMQILISVHMDRFAYMQNLRIRKLKFALGLNQVQISRICIWCKFCIRVKSIHMDRFAHASIFAYMQIFAYVCKSVDVKALLVHQVDIRGDKRRDILNYQSIIMSMSISSFI